MKNIPFAPSALRKIGVILKQGELPSINDISCASNYFNEKKLENLKTENSQEVISLISTNNDLLYLKKIINQDIERTPTFSVEAVHHFFKIELKNGETKVINIKNTLSQNNFKVEFKLRETRNEYRIFLNDLFKEIAPKEKEILMFSKVDDVNFLCEYVPIESSKYKTLEGHFEAKNNHKLIYDKL